MAKIIIFGINDFAELAHYYLCTDTVHEVVAFSVSREYMPSGNEFKELPVIPFENIEDIYSPDDFKFFAPMSAKGMNRLREGIYNEIKNKGYSLISYVSSKATMFDNKIGENCFILEDNTLQPFSDIGNNVILWSGNHIGHHSLIKNHIMLSSHVVVSGHCIIEPYSFLGVNSAIRDGVTIAKGTLVAMGANVLSDTESWGVYTGNPAKKEVKSSKEYF
jgi:sugar O-acyltransferase (sialic acid O-acetyltransferase NeuD family)